MLLKTSCTFVIAVSLVFFKLANIVSSATRWVDYEEYPYVVLLNLTKKGSYCTGSLINPKMVLTTATCLVQEENETVFVYIIKKLNTDDIFHRKANLDILHSAMFQEGQSKLLIIPWYFMMNRKSTRSNIGLIELKKRFECCYVHYIHLSHAMIRPFERSVCKVVGFDVDTDFQSSQHFPGDKVLVKEVEMTVMKQCHENHPGHLRDDDVIISDNPESRAMICQIDNNKVTQSFADSGALLVCGKDSVMNGVAIGLFKVRNFTGPVGDYNVNLVFLDICPYLTWIRSMAGPEVIKSPGFYGRDCFLNGVGRPSYSWGVLSPIFVQVIICSSLVS